MSVHVERSGPVFTVVLHRPEAKNAVDLPTATALVEAFERFDAEPEAKVAVLWGQGGVFCAGADLKAVGTARQSHVAEEGMGPLGPSRLFLRKPVIAAIEGHAVAGGLELACWCDLRVAADDAVLGVFCRRWGVPLLDGGTVRLPRLIGLSRALDLIMTGRPVKADEALSFGLVNRVVPKGRAREAAEALAREVASFPQACMNADRRSAHTQFELSLPDALLHEFRDGVGALKAEGVHGAARFAAGAGRHGAFGE